MRCDLIPFYESNCLFALTSPRKPGHAAFVDPGCYITAKRYLDQSGLILDAILLTHHHPDHIGGACRLQEAYDCEIYGYEGDRARLPLLTRALSEGDEVHILGETAAVMFLPGHTTGLIAYFFAERAALFSGDCVFAMGCGRMFEGTAEQFHGSLRRIAALPSETLIYCAHDYAEANAEFCASYFPEMQRFYLHERQAAREKTLKNQLSIPLLLERELKINPFLTAEDSCTFAKMRKVRNEFVPGKTL